MALDYYSYCDQPRSSRSSEGLDQVGPSARNVQHPRRRWSHSSEICELLKSKKNSDLKPSGAYNRAHICIITSPLSRTMRQRSRRKNTSEFGCFSLLSSYERYNIVNDDYLYGQQINGHVGSLESLCVSGYLLAIHPWTSLAWDHLKKRLFFSFFFPKTHGRKILKPFRRKTLTQVQNS